MAGIMGTGTYYQQAATQGLDRAAQMQTEREDAKRQLEQANKSTMISSIVGGLGMLASFA